MYLTFQKKFSGKQQKQIKQRSYLQKMFIKLNSKRNRKKDFILTLKETERIIEFEFPCDWRLSEAKYKDSSDCA